MTDAASPAADAALLRFAAGTPDEAPAAGSAPEVATAWGSAPAPSGVDSSGRPWPPFAHGSEADMARSLDFYEVRWKYEPRTFPILWNLEGDVVESFSPDFYLPELDLFLEMTTLKQRLVRKKNRKLRRLRELYPDIRIKLFYARDFRAMMLKYGRLALVDSLSGTLGQVMPDRGREPDAEPGTAERAEAITPQPVRPAPPAATGTDTGPALRRNVSRSRRRRAAAAVRSAARAAGHVVPPATRATLATAGTAGHVEEEHDPR